MILAALAAVTLAESSLTFDKPIRVESPRSMVTEIRLGSYYPWVDRPLNCVPSQCPYRRVLGGAMLLVELELERQLFQAFGSAALGISVGYAEKYGHAIANGATTSEATSLRVLPMKLLAAYRFDWAAIKYHVPLVPYVKAGFQLVHWWSTKGKGTDPLDGGGGGWSYGLVGAGGLAFLMDVLDPRLARDFDSGLGVNHTYLFAEFNVAEITNFGAKYPDGKTASALDLSARFFMFGIAFEH